MEKKNYSELLKDPRWVETSKSIKEWDGNKCCYCGDSGYNANLQVHHLYYDFNKKPWEYSERSLVTLCAKCHENTHRIDKVFNELIKEKFNQLGNNGCSKADILSLLELLVDVTSNKECAIPFCNFLDSISCRMGSRMINDVWGRKHKNDMWREINLKYKQCIDYAKKAHKWATGKDDFTEEAYERDEYYDEIIEYKQYMED